MPRTSSGKMIHLICAGDRDQGQAEDQAGDDGDFVGLEDVGGHAGAVADVVAHEVGDDRRVARVVFGDAGLDLAHQVGADVGRLGVDAAAHPHEQGQQRAAEAEAEQGVRRGLAEDDEDDRAAEQAQAVGQHAGDRAGAVGDLAAPRRSSSGRPTATRTLPWTAMRMPNWPTMSENIAPMMKAVARPRPRMILMRSGGHAGEPLQGLRRGRHDVDAEEQGDRQDDDQRQDGLELPGQIGVRALLDRFPDLDHPGSALCLRP